MPLRLQSHVFSLGHRRGLLDLGFVPCSTFSQVNRDINRIAVQGWSSFSPSFDAVDFVSLYIEIPLMIVMFVGWVVFRRILDRKLTIAHTQSSRFGLGDIDLYHDEHDDRKEDVTQRHDEEKSREERLSGPRRLWWKLYYLIV
jgi:AAT family amino acid transporter